MDSSDDANSGGEESLAQKRQQITPRSHVKAESKLSSVVKKEKVNEEPLPDPFPLPSHYRSDVELGLSTGKMTREAKRAFLSSVAAKMLGYKRYPSSEEYTRVAIQITSKYPFFKPPSGSPTVCALT